MESFNTKEDLHSGSEVYKEDIDFVFSNTEQNMSTKPQDDTSLQETIMNAKIELSMAIEELSVIADKSLKNTNVMTSDHAETKIKELNSAVKTAKILVESLRDIFGEPIIMDIDVKIEIETDADLVKAYSFSDSRWEQPENGGLSEDDNKEDLEDNIKTEWETSDDILQENDISLNEGNKSVCNKCGKKYSNQQGLRQHIASVHEGKRYPCDQCEYKPTTKGDLKKHIAKVHLGIVFPCDQCTFMANRKDYLKVHKRNVHQKVPKPKRKPLTGESFGKVEKQKISCKQCDKQYTDASALYKHVQSVHNGV